MIGCLRTLVLSASSQSLHFILSLRLYSRFITSRPLPPRSKLFSKVINRLEGKELTPNKQTDNQPKFQCINLSGSAVVECLCRDRGAAGSSLTGFTALWSLSKNINPSLVLVQPRKTRPFITERLLMGRNESNQTKTKKELTVPPPMVVISSIPVAYG